ncbi:MAG: pilus assembly protein [Chloroflexi bacterium]|nr:pilus assembly protein [Chloroflexota bacterium]HEV8053467.1 TadE/TadG family type IV pilus assembly protein [Candidatus Limnocylindrales bacterium]
MPAPARARLARGRHPDARGQSLAEFALILMPLLLVLLGIVQMGLIFNTYVTIANASREGARSATIYLYDRALSKAQNDTARSDAAWASTTAAMGMLSTNSPQIARSSDFIVSYSIPSGVTESDPRTGQHVRLQMTYHLDLVIPLIADILPRDSGGRLPIGADVTMVVN